MNESGVHLPLYIRTNAIDWNLDFAPKYEVSSKDYGSSRGKCFLIDFFDLLDIVMKAIEEENDRLYQWKKPSSLDDDEGNPNPNIIEEARKFSIDVDRVMIEEVRSDDITREDSFEILM